MFSSEYAYFTQDNLLRWLIRLSRYKFVARMLRVTDRVLEVGSGSGLGSIFLGQHCRQVTGIEISKSEFQEAVKINKRSNVTFEQADFFNESVSELYDVVVAMDVIEHFSESRGRRLIEKIAEHLKPEGMAVIGTPSIYSYPYQGELSQADHIKCYDQKELMEMLDGFFFRSLPFSMNDEVVHTGHHKMAWYYFILSIGKRK
jgi:2-polyprenyl-3-methyl-5-hydroxy-6-metoxy-1,4-benzoquinol methylase